MLGEKKKKKKNNLRNIFVGNNAAYTLSIGAEPHAVKPQGVLLQWRAFWTYKLLTFTDKSHNNSEYLVKWI